MNLVTLIKRMARWVHVIYFALSDLVRNSTLESPPDDTKMDETMEVRVEAEAEKMGDPGHCFGRAGAPGSNL